MSGETDTKPWDDGADFYSTSDDTERLTHTELYDCIWAHLEGCGGTVEEAVTKGLTVCAWKRDAIDIDAEAKDQLKNFVESMCEEIAEKYGEPGEYWQGGPTTKDTEAFEAVALPALVTLLSTIEPWQCSVVGERTFTADELLAWVREHEPEWLETES